MKKTNRGSIGATFLRSLSSMRLGIVIFFALLLLMVAGTLLFRTALLQNAYTTGRSLARNYASDEQSNLTVYETLLSFGIVSIDHCMEEGLPYEELAQWIDLYFDRLGIVLGTDVIDPYAVLDGKILAANPWEGDDTYDIHNTEWFQKAIAADGEPVFTDVYTDVISGKPVITLAQKCKSSDTVMAFDLLLENIPLPFDADILAPEDSLFVCDRTGGLIYKQTSLNCSNEELQAYLKSLIDKIADGSLDRYDASIIDLYGNRLAVYYAHMDNGWYSIVTSPYSNVLRAMNTLFLSFGLILLLFVIVLAGMIWRDLKIRARVEHTNETVRVLGNSYYALYRVDFGKSTYEMIKGSDYVRDRIPPTGPYEDLLRTAGEVIESSAFKEFETSFSTENIRLLVSKRVRNFGGDFLRRFGDEMRWVNVRILFDESLAPEEVVLCFQEVEAEKQRQLQERKLLEDALEIARQTEAAKQTFFSNMSHDMRTPLNAIIGLSELAGQNVDDPDKVSGYLSKIGSAGRQLLGLVNDILDMSRMEQGKVMVDNKQFNLRDCLEECFETFRFQADLEHKNFHADFLLDDTHLSGDPFRINQVLNNLLSNAFKFTHEGDTISVSVSQISRGDYAKYKIVVADTGIGMSKEFLPHLFEPYSREMRFSAKQTIGTGLGMPITKNLVTQMNGEIWVESAPGEGTAFTLILPFAVLKDPHPLSDATNDNAEAFSLEGIHILLAEDNEINMDITTELLHIHGARVTQAWNGVEAVARFRESEPFTFDAILMDMQMPEMDGCTAAKQIRSLHRPDSSTIPILAVTANAFAEDIAATTAAGMNAHISKPIDFSFLCKTLGRYLQRR